MNLDSISILLEHRLITLMLSIKLSSVERDALSLIDSKKGVERSELAQELDKTG